MGSYCDNSEGTYEWLEQGLHNENDRYSNPDKPKGKTEYWYLGRCSFVVNDARQWADWGVDYLKYDWNPNDSYHAIEMHDALLASGRDIVYSLSNSAPYAEAPIWAEETNCYRTTGDIRDNWKSIYKIGFEGQDRWVAFNRPGHWADADMLVLGMVGWGPKLHYTNLTPDEQYTHISLWALLASPMLIGCDMAQLDPFTISLLCNNEVNDICQDPLGIQAYRRYGDKNYATYVKPLEDGSMAVGLFNLSDTAQTLGFVLNSLGFRREEEQTVRDVWRQKDLCKINIKDRYETEVAPHGVVLLRIYPGNPKQLIVESKK